MDDSEPQNPADWALSSYDFELPADRIAQRPAPRRDAARLMVVDGHSGRRWHSRFSSLRHFLSPGDVLVVNDSRVVPARLHGRKGSGGRVEVLLLGMEGSRHWTALHRSSRRPAAGSVVDFGGGLLATWVANREGGRATLAFAGNGEVEKLIDERGALPLPPYIRRPFGPDAADRHRYQTVYAQTAGSVAAPTAGLHFTADLIERLREAGIEVVALTLHVGPATFLPIRTEQLSGLSLEGERYRIPESTAEAIGRARAGGGRVIAVGTTTTRALEAATMADGTLRAGEGVARVVIGPGYRFRAIDGLITNFHLPRSSLIVLLAAFLGREEVERSYRVAIGRGYRFYSYGDAMLAWPPRRSPS